MEQIGQIAALSTAFFWSLTAIFFSKSGELVGAIFLNKIRLLFAVIIYASIIFVLYGSVIPEGINSTQYFWLGISGVVGLALGDSFLFKALLVIGPRLTTLIFSCNPIITTTVAWFFLGEKLSPINLFGIALTTSGILWVILEKQNGNGKNKHLDKKTLIKGVLLALGGATGQALGLILTKQGMSHSGGEIDPLMASYIRLLFALVAIWTVSGLSGHLPNVLRAMGNKKAMLYAFGGTIVGPFLGVWMSLVAIKYISTGIAATLNSLVPIMIIPVVMIVYKEKISPRSWIGAILAVVGVSLLVMY